MFKIKEIHSSDYPYDIDGYDVLRFQYCKKEVNAEGFTCQKKLTAVIDLTQDLDTIWRNMNRNTRRHIDLAKKEGIEVLVNENYEELYQIYKSFIQKKG